MARASAFRDGPREFLEGVARAAVAAAEPGAAVAARGARGVHERAVRVVGAGKAVAGMVRGLVEGCGCRVLGGVIVGPEGTGAAVAAAGIGAGVEVHGADHPLATERNVRAAGRVLEFVGSGEAGAGAPLVVLVSGGASAHLTLPAPGLTLGDIRAATDALLRAGASIDELNCVRKHCEVLKGGGLARAAAGVEVWTLILSDVVGDRLDVIGSGPTAPDPTTYADALGILRARGVLERPDLGAVVRHLERGARGGVPETVKRGDPCLARVRHVIVGSNALAVEGAAASAAAQGCRVSATRTGVTGEAADVGRALAEEVLRLKAGTDQAGGARCVVWGGETTVTVRGRGKGGRNQEVALGAAIALDGIEGVAVASFATDGVDGPTDAAGAFITGRTCAEARRAGLDPARYLAGNDSHTFFMRAGGLLDTGPTGTNVNDIMVGLAW